MKTFVKNYKAILQIPALAIFVGVFYIGGMNLLSIDVNVLPVQILILLVNYPVTIFAIKCTNLEQEIVKYKQEHGME
jgi:hypothetical protein